MKKQYLFDYIAVLMKINDGYSNKCDLINSKMFIYGFHVYYRLLNSSYLYHTLMGNNIPENAINLYITPVITTSHQFSCTITKEQLRDLINISYVPYNTATTQDSSTYVRPIIVS